MPVFKKKFRRYTGSDNSDLTIELSSKLVQDNSRNRKYAYVKKQHELYHKFDEDHEYVVLLLLELIFTELLSEMSKPEVEKITLYKKSNMRALLVEYLSSVFTKKCPHNSSANECFKRFAK